MRISKLVPALALAALLPVSAMAMGFGSDDEEELTYDMGFQKAQMGSYSEAIEVLTEVVDEEPENADAWNMLGFSYRNVGDVDNAWDAYERALAIDPNHRGAHEYIGEWYLMQGDVASAQAQLAKLETLCPDGCVELDTLAASIDSVTGNS